MSSPAPVNIGGVMVGDDYPTVLMAEIGTFFNSDLELARSYILRCHEAGAPVLKTEIVHDPEIVLKNTGLNHTFRHANGSKTEDYRALMERKVVPLEGYRALFGLCHELGMPVVASVYDLDGIDFFVDAGGAGIKIARNNINNVPLIRHAAQTGLPIIFDAGVVYFDEVARAVRLAQYEGAGGVIVTHHPGANPAPPENHNMRIMQTYRQALNIPVGFTCHHVGDEFLYMSVGMGANIIEKGVDIDPTRVEQDLITAASLDELPDIVRKVRNCWLGLGGVPGKFAEPRDLSVRAGLVAKRAIAQGASLTLENVRFSWPPVGISAEQWDLIDGRSASRDFSAGEPIGWNDVCFQS
jgi:sialic acid synthase SpsE